MAFRELDDEIWLVVPKYLPTTKPHIGRSRRDSRRLFNDILYVLTTGCIGHDVQANNDTKSTVHRYHLLGRPFWFDRELYMKRSAVERFSSWIEAFKKITPRYERYEISFFGLIHLAYTIMIWRIMG